MVQNLKVDIIYHLTPSDFEMEFNLCGCCRMRLLNDKTTDKKTFVKALARAVSRSRIIIACGPLFGADGLIKTVTAAIGGKTELCDNKTYGIASDESIEIIGGSTPLVTPDGYFGGCIIESGPQTIILLTENRGFRKTIMQNLIHPYIEEISYIPVSRADTPEPAAQENVSSANDEYITEVDTDIEEETNNSDLNGEFALKDEHNIDFIMDEKSDDSQDLQQEDESSSIPVDTASLDNMYVEAGKNDDGDGSYEYAPSQNDDMFISKVEDEDDKPKKKLKTIDVLIVILVIVLFLAVLSLIYFVVFKPYTMGISPREYLKQIFGASSSGSLL